MREIKFRVWDNAECKMIYSGEVTKHFNENLKKRYNQTLVLTMDGGIRIVQWYDNGITMHPYHDLELMQFTGLKDKNGKEIYEGDILKSKTKKFECKWDGAGFKFDSGRKRDWSTSDTSSLVICGNIHEKIVNPGYYRTTDDSIPVWVDSDGFTHDYTHQDEDYSNMCINEYCRCKD